MSYTTCEDALRTLLAGVTGFSSENVVAGNFGILSLGYDRVLVLSYSDFDQEDDGGGGDRMISWHLTAHLYERYVDDPTVHALAAVDRQAIIDRVNAYYRLNGAPNVNHADVMSGSVPGLGDPPGALANIVIGNVKYYHETFRVTIVEELDFAYAEPA